MLWVFTLNSISRSKARSSSEILFPLLFVFQKVKIEYFLIFLLFTKFIKTMCCRRRHNWFIHLVFFHIKTYFGLRHRIAIDFVIKLILNYILYLFLEIYFSNYILNLLLIINVVIHVVKFKLCSKYQIIIYF